MANVPSNSRKGYEDAKETIDKLDEALGTYLNEYMCSDLCPCYAGANDENKKIYDAYPNYNYTNFKRTKLPISVCDVDLDSGQCKKEEVGGVMKTVWKFKAMTWSKV